MFDPVAGARIYYVPCGVDFPAAVAKGLKSRTSTQAPHDIAKVELYVNTTRMQRRIRSLFTDGTATVLPSLRLITEFGRDPLAPQKPQAANSLARRLELAQLVRSLIATEDSFDTPSRSFDLADSLAGLLEEMQDEGVEPDALGRLDVGDHSDYWRRSQQFLDLVTRYFNSDADTRQRAAILALTHKWAVAPPQHPIIIAGSTGSRGTTRLMMEAVAKLPQGALILPGFDDQMPAHAWRQLDDPMTGEDHPQFRFKTLLKDLELTPDQITQWDTTPPVSPARNALVSLALRPAPVTDEWLTAGPKLQNLDIATENLTLLEAQSARDEAVAIALRLRRAAEDGVSAALITPDRGLTRQVTSALQRWGIEPDDSAGTPLPQTPSGRLLRQTAHLMGRPIASDRLLALLKHPLVCSTDRGLHLLRTRDLELEVLRRDTPFPTYDDLSSWAAKRKSDGAAQDWVTWLWRCLDPLLAAGDAPLDELLDIHINATEALAAGPAAGPNAGQSALWQKASGEQALLAITELRDAQDAGGTLSPAAYGDLIQFTLGRHEVRDPKAPHPGIMIWGTLEARVQGADLVILAGLNDGVWPELPKPDPWLNRQMRKDARLLLPERRVGLSAHDFQQAIAAPEVWLTRARRDAESETVQSRWMNRLTNLMNGLPEGRTALENMRRRGESWLAMAQQIDRPVDNAVPAKRPSPVPPVQTRPTQLPVTQIEKLIRDPYAIYAKYILKLRPLNPLHATADAPLRGRALHEALEKFIDDFASSLPPDAEQRLLDITQTIFNATVPWPATRALWMAKLARAAPWFIATEAARRQQAMPRFTEEKGQTQIGALGFTLEGRADRIDLTPDGHAVIYDYKTGVLPTPKQRKHFDKQLSLLAAIADRGGFAALPNAAVLKSAYIGLGADPKEDAETFAPGDLDRVWANFVTLIASYAEPDKGYSARRAVHETRWSQDYDHLSRYGEWDETDEVHPEKVGQP